MGTVAAPIPRSGRRAAKATILAGALVLVLLLAVALGGPTIGGCSGGGGGDATLQDTGSGDKAIPAAFADAYRAEASKSGVPAAVLAAVGYVETHHGRLTATSSAGAQGPMQFLPSTWANLHCAGSIHELRAAVACSARYLTILAREPAARHADDRWQYAMCRYNGGCHDGIKAEAGYGANGSVAGQIAREYGYVPGSSSATLTAASATRQCVADTGAGVGDVPAAAAPFVGKSWSGAVSAGMSALGFPPGTAWCMIFQQALLKELGITTPDPRSGWSGQPQVWAAQQHWGTLLHGPGHPAATPPRLQPGDLVMYGTSYGDSRHINMVEKVDQRGAITVGGNQGCSFGNGVCERGPARLTAHGRFLYWSTGDTRPIWAIVRPPAPGARA